MTQRAPEPAVPGDEQELRTQIERTREELGQTVEQLAGKADVKSMVKAKSAELTGRMKGTIAAIARERRVPVAVAAAALLAGCVGLLWWKKR